ncbi:hypothetical protein MCOR12_011459 [Pyricularia oryzae]|nr:hypothetical protein MCOR12_011459 [Pyricularia oryzae]
MQAERKTRNNRRHMRLSLPLLPLLLSSTLLLSPTSGTPATPAPATLTFEPCVAMCVRTSECGPDDKNCMCSTSQVFFDSTVRCMYRDCAGCFDSADASFIERVASACRDYGKPVPTPRLREARILADMLARNVKNATTTGQAPPPGPTGTAALGRPIPGAVPGTGGALPLPPYGAPVVTNGPVGGTPTTVGAPEGPTQTQEGAVGYRPVGNQPVGSQPVGNLPVGNLPVGNQPVGNQPVGSQPVGNLPVGNRPAGNQPADNQPSGNQPARNQPSGHQPAGNQTAGNQTTPTGRSGRADEVGREGNGGVIVIGGGGTGQFKNATSTVKQSPVPTTDRGPLATPKPDERPPPAEPTDSSPFASPVGSDAEAVTLRLLCLAFAGLAAVVMVA